MINDTKNEAGKVIKSERYRHVEAQFIFEDWMIGEGVYGLAAAFELAGIKDGECIRISAAQQKKFFGKKVIGNRCIRFLGGRFEAIRSVAYGQDWDIESLEWILKGTEAI